MKLPPSYRNCAWMLAMALVLLASTAAYAQEASSAHHCFQNASYWARVFEQPERAKWQKPDEVVQALGLKPGETVIDIGAGTGYFTRRFARAVAPNGRAIGVDIEPGMVAYMKADAKKLKVANYQAHLAQPDDPQVAPREADVIFFCDVLHHVDNRVAYLRKLTSALKPDGRIAVVDFQKTAPLGPPTAEKISQDEMIAEFKRAGYRLVGKHTFLPYQYFLEFAPESPSAQNKNGRGATEHGPSD